MIANGTQVSYQYRTHHLLGGYPVEGVGQVIDRTIVGTQDAYVIKPTDGSPCVHVRCAGVRPLATLITKQMEMDARGQACDAWVEGMNAGLPMSVARYVGDFSTICPKV